MPTPDPFSRALRRLSKPELQALFEVIAADRTPRERLAEHLKLQWFRSLPPTEMSRAWLALSRDGALDLPPDLLPTEHNPPAMDVAGIPSDGRNGHTNIGGGRRPPP